MHYDIDASIIDLEKGSWAGNQKLKRFILTPKFKYRTKNIKIPPIGLHNIGKLYTRFTLYIFPGGGWLEVIPTAKNSNNW